MKIANVDIGLVSSTDALVDFYVAVLEVEPLEPRSFPFATVHRLPCGPVTLKIMVPVEPPAPTVADGPFWAIAGVRYVTLWVDDLDALASRWVAAGGKVVMPPIDVRPGVRSSVLSDPDGNAVEAMSQSERNAR